MADPYELPREQGTSSLAKTFLAMLKQKGIGIVEHVLLNVIRE